MQKPLLVSIGWKTAKLDPKDHCASQLIHKVTPRNCGGFLQFISCLPDKALSRVFWSAYSRSPPTGKPRARRVTFTPSGSKCWRRYRAVASPSMLGLVARITSLTPPLETRAINCLIFKSSGPMPSMGDKTSLQDMIFSLETAGALKCQHVERLLDHADQSAIAP